MPFVGLGLHLLVALFFAVHAMRSGQNMYWLVILFSFPLLGSVVYFLVVYLPNSRLERGARKAVAAAVKALDPERELREARAAFDYTPTAQNQMWLASALLEAGQAQEAAGHYEACLKGPFASDPEIRYGAARAWVECGRHAQAITHLQGIRQGDPAYRPEALALLLARALGGDGRAQEAQAEFENALRRFGSFDARAEYAIWALGAGDMNTAERLKDEIEHATQRWNRQHRELNAVMMRRLESAWAAARPDARG